MSTLRVTNIQHESAASPTITLASNGTATVSNATLTGATLTNPTLTLQSENVSPFSGFRNRFINGAMVIDQRNAGASVTITNTSTGTYTVDRWQAYGTQASKFSVQQNAGAVTPPTGYSSYVGITSLSAYSVTSTDRFQFGQAIEGFNTSDLAFGTASAATVTLSFWVRSSLTGTFGGTLGNNAGNRNYPFTFTISSANTWEQKIVTIVGDTTGTWVGGTNGIGLIVIFGLGAGSTLSGTAGAWTSSFVVTATGATSVVGTNGATFYLTGVQLEKGTVATPFEFRSHGQELALCQRYYCKSYAQGTSPGTATHTGEQGVSITVSGYTSSVYFQFPVTMRSAPTVTNYSTSTTNTTGVVTDYVSGGSNRAILATYGPSDASFWVTANAGAPSWVAGHYTASAEL